MEKTNVITKKYFNQNLDKRFDEFEKRIDKKFDEFALIVAGGFAAVDQRFKNLEEYLNENFATKLDLYETESRLSNKIDKMDERVNLIERHIGRIDTKLGHIEETILEDIKPRIKNLEQEVGI